MNSTKSDCPAVTTTISYGNIKKEKELFNIADFLDHAPAGINLWYTVCNEYLKFITIYKGTNEKRLITMKRESTGVIFDFDEYGRRYFETKQSDDFVSLFPDRSNLFWQTDKSPNLAAEIIFPRCTGSVIIGGDGDALLVGSEEYYYFRLAGRYYEYVDTCRFHKLDYNGVRFATGEESKEFYDKLTNSGYKFVDGYVIAHPELTSKNDKELKQRGFEYSENICEWVNSNQNNIEVVSIVPDNRGFTNSNFILFYYEK